MSDEENEIETTDEPTEGANIHFGCGPFPAVRKGYAENFDFVELSELFTETPRFNTMKSWRTNFAPEFEFIAVANQWLTADPLDLRAPVPEGLERKHLGMLADTEANAQLWAQTVQACEAVGARRLLLKTPPSFFPNDRNKASLARYGKLAHKAELTLIWEPRGMWVAEDLVEVCAGTNIIAAVDPFVENEFGDPPDGDSYYVITAPRGRRDFTPDDFDDLLDYFDEHQGEVYTVFRGAERAENALAFLRHAQRR